jgi:hypothetical protein
MDQYSFGGSRWMRIRSRIIASFVWSGCGISRFFIAVARWINSTTVRLRVRANRLLKESEPITVHITRIVPLDRWTLRIEFTVDRKTKYCMHQDSLNGGYAETFAKFKRGEEIQIIEAHYHMVATDQEEWKKM